MRTIYVGQKEFLDYHRDNCKSSLNWSHMQADAYGIHLLSMHSGNEYLFLPDNLASIRGLSADTWVLDERVTDKEVIGYVHTQRTQNAGEITLSKCTCGAYAVKELGHSAWCDLTSAMS